MFAADTLSKLRELERESASTAPARSRSSRLMRLHHYRRSSALLEERLPDSPLVHELHDELAAFQHRPASSGGRGAPTRRAV